MKPNPSVDAARDPAPPPIVPLEYVGQDDPGRPPARAQTRRRQVSSKRFAAAWAIASISDVLSLGFTFAPPLELALDLVTAVALFAVLGWRWMLLPALILEAIPGVSALPCWVLVVSSIATWGTPRVDQTAPGAPRPSSPR